MVWGAPLGTYVVHLLEEHRLIAFVGMLAAVEVISTFILLDDLHDDPALIAYCVGGLITVAVGVRLLHRYRREILDLPAAPPPQPHEARRSRRSLTPATRSSSFSARIFAASVMDRFWANRRSSAVR